MYRPQRVDSFAHQGYLNWWNTTFVPSILTTLRMIG
jgi:hypothetical protein